MSNIKSWADHCSSDEESDDDRIAPPPSGLPGSSSYGGLNQLHEEESDEHEEELFDHEPPPPKEYVLPDGHAPPYTAFIGSLPFDLRNSNDLGAEVEGMLQKREPGVRIRDVRLMTERDTGKSRGYGYVEFDTPEEVRIMMLYMNMLVVYIIGFLLY